MMRENKKKGFFFSRSQPWQDLQNAKKKTTTAKVEEWGLKQRMEKEQNVPSTL